MRFVLLQQLQVIRRRCSAPARRAVATIMLSIEIHGIQPERIQELTTRVLVWAHMPARSMRRCALLHFRKVGGVVSRLPQRGCEPVWFGAKSLCSLFEVEGTTSKIHTKMPFGSHFDAARDSLARTCLLRDPSASCTWLAGDSHAHFDSHTRETLRVHWPVQFHIKPSAGAAITSSLHALLITSFSAETPSYVDFLLLHRGQRPRPARAQHTPLPRPAQTSAPIGAVAPA